MSESCLEHIRTCTIRQAHPGRGRARWCSNPRPLASEPSPTLRREDARGPQDRAGSNVIRPRGNTAAWQTCQGTRSSRIVIARPHAVTGAANWHNVGFDTLSLFSRRHFFESRSGSGRSRVRASLPMKDEIRSSMAHELLKFSVPGLEKAPEKSALQSNDRAHEDCPTGR